MKIIAEFFWDCGRQGELEGTFIVDLRSSESTIGKSIDFGEALGKHSSIMGILEEASLTVKSEDQDFIAKFEEIMGEDWSTGHNPFHHLPNDE